MFYPVLSVALASYFCPDPASVRLQARCDICGITQNITYRKNIDPGYKKEVMELITTAAQMGMGFILPFALTFVAMQNRTMWAKEHQHNV